MLLFYLLQNNFHYLQADNDFSNASLYALQCIICQKNNYPDEIITLQYR